MTQGIYIVGAELGSGKSVIVLGMMEMLCGSMGKIGGYGRDAMQVATAARGLLDSLKERKCDTLALVVNRVQASLVDAVTGALKQVLQPDIPAYVLPELTILAKPTVGEIAVALGAERLSGKQGSLDREVRNFKIAAMELPNFLQHIEEGSLILAPGDRSDILLGRVKILVIPTDEEREIAQQTMETIKRKRGQGR